MNTIADKDRAALELPPLRRALVLFTVVIGSTAYIAATFSASALLPQMQGALAATQDEIAWTVTFNILAAAIATPMSGWLITSFGRRNVQLYSIAIFTFATLMCGLSDSLETLVMWRMIQGASGAPLIPLGQTIILDVFPRRQHRFVIALFGMANTLGPVLGPAAAGYLAEYASWRWGFYMIIPIGVVSTIAVPFGLPRDTVGQRISLDWIGFISMAVAVAASQLMFARGQRLDWFESTEIIVEAALAAVALYIFVVHSVTHRAPFLNLRLLLDRNYAVGLFLVLLFGMLNFTPMVLLPPLLKSELAQPDYIVGVVVSWRGIGVLAGFFVSMAMGRLDPRIGMALGFVLQIISGLWLMSINLNVGADVLSANAFLQGLAVGVIWTPLATTTFWTLAPQHRPEAVAVFHLMRNIGSSMFISWSVAAVIKTASIHYNHMTEFVNPTREMLSMPWVMGGWSIESVSGIAQISQEIGRQARLIGYLNAFGLYTVASVIALPFVLIVRRERSGV
ncbi:MAG: DHA2 family efflux MFS transporter permease subunit [Chromatiales bacterium]|jgi:MFS transporter, DHA2 family, multidrug resistance protein|nr:DHA2 family efflux MFS transporter permease subunit [Chromatiales bacterium]